MARSSSWEIQFLVRFEIAELSEGSRGRMSEVGSLYGGLWDLAAKSWGGGWMEMLGSFIEMCFRDGGIRG